MSKQTWALDQLLKSQFFQQKLQEWHLLDSLEQLEAFHGETLEWQLSDLQISETAWNKLIHRGIKPILAFAQADVLTTIPYSTAYYRMLAMVSQKSMKRIGIDTERYEYGTALPDSQTALRIAQTLNPIISKLIEASGDLNRREFDLWRGMAAGTQAQGSWQNAKGDKTEVLIQNLFIGRLQAKGLLKQEDLAHFKQISLDDGRKLVFSDEPDIAIYDNGQILIAIEVKGGIDSAGVLERLGASLKSLQRSKQSNPAAITILLLQASSLTSQSQHDLLANQHIINYWFVIEELLTEPSQFDEFFQLIGL